MDPIGFALESFDAVGKYRTFDENFEPIDNTGVYADGTRIDGLAGLRQVLVNHSEPVPRQRDEHAADLRAGPRRGVLRRAGGPRDPARRGAAELPLLVAHSRHRQERSISDEEIRLMIITKKALSRRTFLRGMGVSLALPLLDAMVPALSAVADTAAKPVQRYGFFYMPNGVAMNHTGVNYWKPTDRRRRLRVLADSEAARAVPESGDRGERAAQSVGREPRRRQRRPHAQHRLVADRHAHQANRRLRSARRHLGRSGHRVAVPEGDAAAVARAGDSAELRDRRLRHRLQLRLRHDAGVGVADDAAADAEQSAAGVRAAVRRRRPGLAAARGRPHEEQHSRLGDRGDGQAADEAGPDGSLDGRPTTSTCCAKSNAAFSRPRRRTR